MSVPVPDGLVSGADGPIPAIVQDRATGDVLMVAFASAEARDCDGDAVRLTEVVLAHRRLPLARVLEVLAARRGP